MEEWNMNYKLVFVLFKGSWLTVEIPSWANASNMQESEILLLSKLIMTNIWEDQSKKSRCCKS